MNFIDKRSIESKKCINREYLTVLIGKEIL